METVLAFANTETVAADTAMASGAALGRCV